jgi:hypothetical protein
MEATKTAGPTWWELRQVLKLSTKSKKPRKKPTVEELTSLSRETLVRRYSDKIKHLSDKRLGMTLGDALEIAEGK